MAVFDLLQVPKTQGEWEIWSFAHRDSHDRIREAIEGDGGAITGYTIVNGGSGYSSIPNIDIGGGGQGAQINITITRGVITSFTVAQGGVGYVNPTVTLTGGGGSGANILATASEVVNLTEYLIYPLNINDQKNVADFLQNNQSLHSDFNGVLGLQSSDLQDVDLTQENQLTAWIWNHYLEHQSAESALGI